MNNDEWLGGAFKNVSCCGSKMKCDAIRKKGMGFQDYIYDIDRHGIFRY